MVRPAFLALSVALCCGALVALAAAADRTGTRHGDQLVGTKGDDVLKGLAGADRLHGGGGRDLLIGGGGPDRLDGDGGHDSFNIRDGVELAANGADRIDARDGHPDEINCGAGSDVAVVDEVEDGIYNCEAVLEP